MHFFFFLHNTRNQNPAVTIRLNLTRWYDPFSSTSLFTKRLYKQQKQITCIVKKKANRRTRPGTGSDPSTWRKEDSSVWRSVESSFLNSPHNGGTDLITATRPLAWRVIRVRPRSFPGKTTWNPRQNKTSLDVLENYETATELENFIIYLYEHYIYWQKPNFRLTVVFSAIFVQLIS